MHHIGKLLIYSEKELLVKLPEGLKRKNEIQIHAFGASVEEVQIKLCNFVLNKMLMQGDWRRNEPIYEALNKVAEDLKNGNLNRCLNTDSYKIDYYIVAYANTDVIL